MVNKLPTEQECPIDNVIMRFIDTHLHVYKTLGFTPNMVTTLGLLFGLWSAYLITQKQLAMAALVFIISYYFDCVDGKLARRYDMQTQFGDLYDHTADTIKLCAVLYALFTYNTGSFAALWRRRPTFGFHQHQVFLLVLIAVTSALMLMHLGYQEVIYDKSKESWTLQMFKQFVAFDPHPEDTICLTRHFGCGTMISTMAAAMYMW